MFMINDFLRIDNDTFGMPQFAFLGKNKSFKEDLAILKTIGGRNHGGVIIVRSENLEKDINKINTTQ